MFGDLELHSKVRLRSTRNSRQTCRHSQLLARRPGLHCVLQQQAGASQPQWLPHRLVYILILLQALEEGVLRFGLWALPAGGGTYTVSSAAFVLQHTVWPAFW